MCSPVRVVGPSTLCLLLFLMQILVTEVFAVYIFLVFGYLTMKLTITITTIYCLMSTQLFFVPLSERFCTFGIFCNKVGWSEEWGICFQQWVNCGAGHCGRQAVVVCLSVTLSYHAGDQPTFQKAGKSSHEDIPSCICLMMSPILFLFSKGISCNS